MSKHRLEIEAWWAFVVRVLSFIFGTQLVAYDALFMVAATEVRLGFLFAGIACMGPVIAASLAQVVQAARGGGSGA